MVILLLSMSPNFVLQLLLLLFKPPASEPADDSLPLPEELSLCALGEGHIGLALAANTKSEFEKFGIRPINQ